MSNLNPEDILKGKVCPYCFEEPELVNSTEVYGEGHDYGNLYLCRGCDAFVGTHHGKTKPLGRLANRELREWKKKAHQAFDPLWKQGEMSRQQAYRWLAGELGIREEYCHIGMFSIRYCKKTIKVCENFNEGTS